MLTHHLVCKKITKIDNIYWEIIKSSNEEYFPIGLLLVSEDSAKEIDLLDVNHTLGPPFIDKTFEKWLRKVDLKNYRKLNSKPKLNIKLFIKNKSNLKIEKLIATCVLDNFNDDTDPLGEYIIMSIFLERELDEDRSYFLGDLIDDINSENLFNEHEYKNLFKDEEFSRREKNLYLKIELLIKNTNDKLEEILESLFYSNNSFMERMVNLENIVKNIEKEDYIPKEDYNIINLFFKGGIKNLIAFIIILMIFNEIFVFGPLRTLRVLQIFRYHIVGEDRNENNSIQKSDIDKIENP